MALPIRADLGFVRDKVYTVLEAFSKKTHAKFGNKNSNERNIYLEFTHFNPSQKTSNP
jgi:hypothetical protein